MRFPAKIAALLAVLLFFHSAFSQETPGRFQVRTWQSEDGLPSNTVRAVTQAADGYLWVATAEGLARFDGVRFTGFDGESQTALARRDPRRLLALRGGDLWVATARGGLLRWHAGRLQSVWKDGESGAPQPLPITRMIEDGPDGLFIARGTEVWQARAAETPRRVEQSPELETRFRAETEAHPGQYPPGADGPELHDRAGRHWKVSPSGGLSVSDAAGETEPIALPMLGPANRISQLFEDREGNLWVATGEIGLVQIRARRVEVLTVADGLKDRAAAVVLAESSGAVWIGSKSGGLDRMSGGVVEHFRLGEGGPARLVSALFEAPDGTLWAATRNGSVFRFSGGKFQTAFRSGTGPSKVAAIQGDTLGRLWFGGLNGLSLYAGGQLSTLTLSDGATPRDITALALDTAGTLWVGTAKGGLFQWKNRGLEPVAAAEALAGFGVSAFYPEADGSLWGATLGGGLFHWKAGRFTRFFAPHGLPDSRITTVLDDGAGHLWLGSLGGIFRVSKADLAAIESGKKTLASWLQLDRSDGLLTRECTGSAQPAGWRTADGRLYFPTANGVVRIRPDQMAINTVAPQVKIEDFSANGHRQDLGGGDSRVGPGRTRLEFSYTALSFSPPEKVRFRVRLSGLENEWRDAGPRRSASFEAVPAGNYRFEVMAANGDGVWNEVPAEFAVEVQPYFWETRWFLLLGALSACAVASGLGWGVARQRMKRRLAGLELQRAREAERARIARDLHDDLGASLTQISLLATLSAEENAGAGQAPLSEIAAKAQSLLGTLDEIVWAINPRHDTLASLVDYLPASAAEFLENAGVALRLDVARGLPPIALDAERRHGLFLALREALHNAVKHSGTREIWLRLRVQGRALELTIEDNGRGFDPALETAGDGLRNLRERLAGLGGLCRVESAPGQGTRVFFSLPMGNAA